MTTRQILARCRVIDPSRSYCITLARWYFSHTKRIDVTEYRLSVLPGLNGKACQQFHGTNFTTCFTAYEQALKDAVANQQTTEPTA